jgi:hypothetical protein
MDGGVIYGLVLHLRRCFTICWWLLVFRFFIFVFWWNCCGNVHPSYAKRGCSDQTYWVIKQCLLKKSLYCYLQKYLLYPTFHNKGRGAHGFCHDLGVSMQKIRCLPVEASKKKYKIIFASFKSFEIMFGCAKSQYKICYILECIKIIKSDKYYSFEICIIHHIQIDTFINHMLPRV